MVPAILPGDWLVLSPLRDPWPGNGAVVVFREPLGETLAIKRVAARGRASACRSPAATSMLADDEAWLLSDADEKAAAAAGSGPPIDSQRYGPVQAEALVGRVLFRYWPLRRFGRIAAGPRRDGRAGMTGRTEPAATRTSRSPAPRPVGRDGHAVTPRRAAVAHDGDDRGRAGAGRAAARRDWPTPRAPLARLAEQIRATAIVARPIVVTGCGTSEHGAWRPSRSCATRLRTAGPAVAARRGRRAGRRPGVRGLARGRARRAAAS